jgi:hypothetical protein
MNRRGREVEESRRESVVIEGKTPVPSVSLSRSIRGATTLELRRKNEYMRMPLIVGSLSQKFYKATTKGASQEVYETAVDLYLETFTEGFSEAYEFVVCIATAKSRQEFIQTYEINAASLYASVVLGLTPEHVCQKLTEFSKMEGIDPKVREFIYTTTSSYGKIRLVLMKNQYFLESEDPNVIKYYRDMPNLQDCWKSEIYVTDPSKGASTTADLTPFPRTHSGFDGEQSTKMLLEEPNEALMKFIDQKGDEKGRPPKKYIPIYRLEVQHNKIDKVRIEREGNARYKYMLSQEFDYEDIDEADRLPVTLRAITK